MGILVGILTRCSAPGGGARTSIELRLKDAHLPRIKTLEEFDFAQSPHTPASRIRALAEGSYLARAEPVLLIGEPGTGKAILLPVLRSQLADSADVCASSRLQRWSINS